MSKEDSNLKNDGKNGEEETSADNINKENLTATASITEVFQNADALDYLYMAGGTVGGIVTGLSLPAFNVLFGQMLDKLNGSENSLSSGVASLCIAFVIISMIILFSGFFQMIGMCPEMFAGKRVSGELELHNC